MRLDKYLCDCGIGSRSEVKREITSGNVSVNNRTIKDCGTQVSENDLIIHRGNTLKYKANLYYVMNKPAGYITATKDDSAKTVMDLIEPSLAGRLVPVGRLDKDTEGLLLFTDDGELNHKLLSPKRHVSKTYRCLLESSISDDDIKCLENGVDIGDKVPTMPAIVERTASKEILLTIREGRYHQVKRMLEAVNNKVIYLQRTAFGPMKLSETGLNPGECRELTDEEINMLKAAIQ